MSPPPPPQGPDPGLLRVAVVLAVLMGVCLLGALVIEHNGSTQGGPATRWGVCSCDWASDVEHRGALARMCAAQDAAEHVAEKAAIAHAQAHRAER